MKNDINIKNKYDDYCEEELIILICLGDDAAYEALFHRFNKRFLAIAQNCVNTLPFRMDRSDIMFSCLSTFMVTVSSYRLGRSSFFSFYRLCLIQDLYKKATQYLHSTGGHMPVCFDETTDTTTAILADYAAGAYSYEDPRVYYDYLERLRELDKLPKSLHKMTGTIVKMVIDGYTLIDISKKLSVSYRTVKEIYSKFKDWARNVASNEI